MTINDAKPVIIDCQRAAGYYAGIGSGINSKTIAMGFTYTYPRPAVTTDALVLAPAGNEWLVLLIRRLHEPFEGEWALPGGFINMDETLMEACLRELWEETGLTLPCMEQFRVFDAIGRDPRHRTLSVVFYAFLPEKARVTGGDDAALARWFPVSRLPGLAFDHREIISEFLKSQLMRF